METIYEDDIEDYDPLEEWYDYLDYLEWVYD
jgi:hypothetical protein